jgi:hypothetical protein
MLYNEKSGNPVREYILFLFKATILYPDGIRSHGSELQSPRWQAETIPLDLAWVARFF